MITFTRTPMPSSPSSLHSVFIMAHCCRVTQILYVFLAKVLIAAKSPLQTNKQTKQSFEKIHKHFLGKSLNLSFSYYYDYLFYLILLLDTHQFEFTFLLLDLYKVDNNLKYIESSSDCNGNTGAYVCLR